MARKAAAEALTIDGGRRPRKRKADGYSWTAAKERRFLQALAETCNVKHSAIAAKVNPSTVYVRREKDARFRRSWDSALSTGYAQLELMMLERALHGVEKIVVPVRGGEPTVMREYSDRVGLALLRMHRDTVTDADQETNAAEVDEAADRIMARLDKLQPAEIETKGEGSRHERIADAVRRLRASR